LDDFGAELLGRIFGTDADVLEKWIGLVLGEDGDRLAVSASKAHARSDRNGCR
jgi:hypothetical protein